MKTPNFLSQPDPALNLDDGNQRAISSQLIRLGGIAAGILLAAGLVALGLWIIPAIRGKPAQVQNPESQPTAAIPAGSWSRQVVSEDGLAERIGVRIVQVSLTGSGGLLDLRYQVLDPEKAYALHDETTPPALVESASGLVVNSLLMGHSHTGSYQPGITYFYLFENPDNLIQAGSKVNVLLGNLEVDGISVR